MVPGSHHLPTIGHAAIAGLAALLQASAVAFQTLKYVGVAYLLYIAWITVRDKGAVKSTQRPRPGPRHE